MQIDPHKKEVKLIQSHFSHQSSAIPKLFMLNRLFIRNLNGFSYVKIISSFDYHFFISILLVVLLLRCAQFIFITPTTVSAHFINFPCKIKKVEISLKQGKALIFILPFLSANHIKGKETGCNIRKKNCNRTGKREKNHQTKLKIR